MNSHSPPSQELKIEDAENRKVEASERCADGDWSLPMQMVIYVVWPVRFYPPVPLKPARHAEGRSVPRQPPRHFYPSLISLRL